MSSLQDMGRIHQKWGFGMAPIKPAVQQSRLEAAQTVRTVLEGAGYTTMKQLEHISIAKGLFTRSFKRDQWDWFTVWSQLGFPSSRMARQAAGALSHLRVGLRDGHLAAQEIIAPTTRSDILAALGQFVADTDARPPGHGFIYILSTREVPDVLKIGYTDRDVATRVREINSATGVLIPYGARAAWLVPQARCVESDLHDRLADFRVRKDREFFRIPFADAAKIVDTYVANL